MEYFKKQIGRRQFLTAGSMVLGAGLAARPHNLLFAAESSSGKAVVSEKNLSERVADMEAVNRQLKARAAHLNSILAITNLQSLYNHWLALGYYKRIWDELFTHENPGATCEIGDSGVYEGPESIKRLWTALEKRERRQGYMANIHLMDPYILVSKDGKTAKGMWWAQGPCADYATPYPGDQEKLTAYWFFGKYNNRYVKENNGWKILSLHTVIYYRTPYDRGWAVEPDCIRWETLKDAPPDKPSTLNEIYDVGKINTWKPHPFSYEYIEQGQIEEI